MFMTVVVIVYRTLALATRILKSIKIVSLVNMYAKNGLSPVQICKENTINVKNAWLMSTVIL